MKKSLNNMIFGDFDNTVYDRKGYDSLKVNSSISLDDYNRLKSDTIISDKKNSVKTNKKVKTKSFGKKIINAKNIVVFSTVGILGFVGVSLFKDRKPIVNSTNISVVDYVSSDKSIDEIVELYNSELEKSNVEKLDSTRLCNILSGENNIVTAIDKISFYLSVSDKLADYDLDGIVSFNGNLRSLTEEEMFEVETLTTEELIDIIDQFDDMEEISYDDFSKESILKCSLGMKLSYAEKIINNQLVKYGSSFLSAYPELIVQSTVIDETGLDYDSYSNILIKDIDNDNYYEVLYYEDKIGAYYNVELEDKYLRLVAKDKEFFDNYNINSSEYDFKDYKNHAREAINDYKIVLLKDYSLKTNSRHSVLEYELDSSDTNSDIRKKIKKIK